MSNLKAGELSGRRGQFAVLGPLHQGFGFDPEGIVKRSKEVARARTLKGEETRQMAANQPLETRAEPLPGAVQMKPRAPLAPAEWKKIPAALPVIHIPPWRGLESDAHGPNAQPRNMRTLGTASSTAAGPSLSGPALTARGKKPTGFAVLMAIFVDGAFAFSVLTVLNLLVHVQGWSLQSQGTIRSVVDKFGAGLILNSVHWHWLLVFGLWVVTLYLLQFLCVSLFRSTLGRILVGVSVNPVASRHKGTFLLPFFEVLTFGGLFVLPLALIGPDRHLFLRSLRFHIAARNPSQMF